MSKATADGLKKIQIWWLKKNGYLNGWRSGKIIWTHSWSGSESSIGISVTTYPDGQGHIQLTYTQTDNYTDEKKDFNYPVRLTTTPCQLGGHRFWFICPLSVSGVPCGRRVGVLYKAGDHFGCRHCYDLTYDSRNLSGYAKQGGAIISLPELERLKGEAKREQYKGKYTKKYLRYLMRRHKSEDQLFVMVAGLSKSKKMLDHLKHLKKK